ncbi:unnamed protein product, partial [Meganyctiphanes norvegica]
MQFHCTAMLHYALMLVYIPTHCLGLNWDGWIIPDQEEHRYHKDVESEFTVRQYMMQEVHPRTALLCPRGFAISRITMRVTTGQDIVEANPDLKLHIAYSYWLVLVDDGIVSDEEEGLTKCPSLRNCLGYQACLFNFGNEFCHMDPIPGQRKNLNLNVTCLREDKLMTFMGDVKYQSGFISEIRERMDKVLHMTYVSKLEEGMADYSLTEIMQREAPESQVFHGTCPNLADSRKQGYRGACDAQPPDPVDVSESLWSLLGRVPGSQCRKELQQVYCSFLYHNKGLCLPPYTLEPGQDENLLPEEVKIGRPGLPTHGPRPDLSSMSQLMQDPNRDLIPVRLGFLILVHKDPPALMQLLQLIYRPWHYYVFHVDVVRQDTRDNLKSMINKLMPKANNIRVLPASRSFRASWGSWNIVRAELEVFEELLRMGLWDFAIKLSGADLPLRDVDDLAATLAAYRGHSFIPLFGNRNKDMEAEQGLVWDVWHGCDGYVYNVTRGGGQPTPEEIKIYTGSQWSIPSREMVAYSLDSKSRAAFLNRWHFHLQTSIIPDEAYFPTIAMNAPSVNLTHPLGFHWLKRFEGRNAINLCRHMEDADFCGQGPGPVEEGDLREIVESSHRYFFARKFHTTNPSEVSRIKISDHVRTEYPSFFRRNLPKALLRQMVQMAFPALKKELEQHPVLGKMALRPGDCLGVRVMPRLHLIDPCCSLAFERSFKSTQEFIYWIDFAIESLEGDVVGGARASVIPRPVCYCYPDGHLRAMRWTTWPENPEEMHRAGLTTNIPLPFARAGTDVVYIELWFHAGDSSISEDCRNTMKGRILPGTPMMFYNLNIQEVTADPLTIVVQLLDPKGNLRCEERKTDVWDSYHIHPNRDGERIEMPSFFTLACGPMEPGSWTIRVYQKDMMRPQNHSLATMILPDLFYIKLVMGIQIYLKNADSQTITWNLRTANLILKDFQAYNDAISMPSRDVPHEYRPIKEEIPTVKEEITKEPMTKHHKRDNSEHFSFNQQGDTTFGLWEWLVCYGGVLTSILTAVFTHHWVILPLMFSVRASPRMQRSAGVVIFAVFLQILMCSLYCR